MQGKPACANGHRRVIGPNRYSPQREYPTTPGKHVGFDPIPNYGPSNRYVEFNYNNNSFGEGGKSSLERWRCVPDDKNNGIWKCELDTSASGPRNFTNNSGNYVNTNVSKSIDRDEINRRTNEYINARNRDRNIPGPSASSFSYTESGNQSYGQTDSKKFQEKVDQATNFCKTYFTCDENNKISARIPIRPDFMDNFNQLFSKKTD